MTSISDLIEEFLLDTMGNDGQISISRNELANYFSVAPSQINYVLSTRFTPDRGFVIRSRRGGGGSVTVVRVMQHSEDLLTSLIGEFTHQGLSYSRACQISDRLTADKIITEREAIIIKQALSDKALVAPSINKDILRAGIMRSVLCRIAEFKEEDRE